MSVTKEQAKQNANAFRSNIEGQRSTQSSRTTVTNAGSTTTTVTPEKTTNSLSYTVLDKDALAAGDAAYENSMRMSGYEKDENGNWKAVADPTIGWLLGMKKDNEEANRINRLKTINSGVYDAISLIGDMVGAGMGGNVIAREKNDIAEKAAAETTARKAAMRNAEYEAEKLKHADLIKALTQAQSARDTYNKLMAKKVSLTHTPETTSVATRSPYTSTTSTSSTRVTSPSEAKTVAVNIPMASGGNVSVGVNKSVYDDYISTAQQYLKDNATNPQLMQALIAAGAYDPVSGIKESKLKSAALNTAVLNAAPELKGKVQDMYFSSLEFAQMIHGKNDNEFSSIYDNESAKVYGYDD